MSNTRTSWARIGAVVLASAAMAPVIASAQSLPASATAGVGWTVDTACTVTGNAVNYGVFFAGQSADDVRQRLGSYLPFGPETAGSAGDTYVLATVNCPSLIAWNLAITGGADLTNDAAAISVRGNGTTDTTSWSVWPIVFQVDGTPVGSGNGVNVSNVKFPPGLGNLTAFSRITSYVSGVGTGNPQQIVGGYHMTTQFDSSGTGGTLSAGSYIGQGTVYLQFFPPA
jgi:hypothetical protein